jgi:Flp pilus assembly protein TadD
LTGFYRRVLDLCRPEPGNRWLALFAATWFAVHTVNTETMNLMHARSEILSALGIVTGFLVYLASPRLRRFHLYLVPVALGALAKPPAVLFGPLLFVLELLARRWVPPETGRDPAARASWKGALRGAAAAAAPAVLAGAALFVFVGRMDAPTFSLGGGDRYHYALTQVWTWVHYLRLFVLPAGLSADTDLKLLTSVFDTRVFAGLLILGGLALVGWRCAQSRNAWPVAFGLAWFALGVAPTSSILPLAEPLNEHRVFLPFIGLILAVVWGARLVWEALAEDTARSRTPRRALPVAVCVLILAAHAVGTHARNEVWKTGESLWKDVTEKSPGNGRGWMNYGVALMARGDLQGARACFDRALPLLPYYSTLQVNLGVVHSALGDQETAERHFERALELAPGHPDSHYFYARWLADRGRGPEALEHLDAAIRLAPGAGTATALRQDLLAARGDGGVTPAHPPAGASAKELFWSGVSLGSRGRYLDSALSYRASLALDPQSADTLNNLGWTLGKLGFFPQAVPFLEEAVRLRPDFALARNNLAWVKSQEKSGGP